jgi:hypothetical protein
LRAINVSVDRTDQIPGGGASSQSTVHDYLNRAATAGGD